MLRAFLVLTIALFALISAPALAGKDGEIFGEGDNANRTVNRSPIGRIFYPDWLIDKPEHYEFLPLVSNHDPQNQHPQQWQGQDWDVAALKEHGWTPEMVIEGFYRNRTFQRRYISGPSLEPAAYPERTYGKRVSRKSNMATLVVGPTFYRLSDLDRRRSLKLLTDHEKVFEHGVELVELRDWDTNGVIGGYTRRGLFLN